MKVNRGESICRGKLFVTLFMLLFSIMAYPSMKVAGVEPLTVSATVISKDVCLFVSGAANRNFGAIDPAGTTDITRTATMKILMLWKLLNGDLCILKQ